MFAVLVGSVLFAIASHGASAMPINGTETRLMSCFKIPAKAPDWIPYVQCSGVDVADLTDENSTAIVDALHDDRKLRRRDVCDLPCQTDHLLFNASLPEFLEARKKKNPPELDWKSDGCSDAPEHPFGFNFAPSCNRHDFGYHNYRKQGRLTERTHELIDNNLLEDLKSVCLTYEMPGQHGQLRSTHKSRKCRRIAYLYFTSVRLFTHRESNKDDPPQNARMARVRPGWNCTELTQDIAPPGLRSMMIQDCYELVNYNETQTTTSLSSEKLMPEGTGP